MTQFTKEDQKKVNEKFEGFKNGNFTSAERQTVLDHIEEILEKGSSGALSKFFGYIKTMCEMVKAWAAKEYTGIPVKTIGVVILTLVYIFMPQDIIPDYIPVIGLMDDAAMVDFCLKAAKSDLDDFREWQKGWKQSA